MDKLEPILAATFKIHPEDLTDASRIGEVPGWDSLSHMNLIANLESRLKIELTGDEIAEMQSVRQIKETLRHRGIVL